MLSIAWLEHARPKTPRSIYPIQPTIKDNAVTRITRCVRQSPLGVETSFLDGRSLPFSRWRSVEPRCQLRRLSAFVALVALRSCILHLIRLQHHNLLFVQCLVRFPAAFARSGRTLLSVCLSCAILGELCVTARPR